jgi:hypothetical protein
MGQGVERLIDVYIHWHCPVHPLGMAQQGGRDELASQCGEGCLTTVRDKLALQPQWEENLR